MYSGSQVLLITFNTRVTNIDRRLAFSRITPLIAWIKSFSHCAGPFKKQLPHCTTKIAAKLRLWKFGAVKKTKKLCLPSFQHREYFISAGRKAAMRYILARHGRQEARPPSSSLPPRSILHPPRREAQESPRGTIRTWSSQAPPTQTQLHVAFN